MAVVGTIRAAIKDVRGRETVLKGLEHEGLFIGVYSISMSSQMSSFSFFLSFFLSFFFTVHATTERRAAQGKDPSRADVPQAGEPLGPSRREHKVCFFRYLRTLPELVFFYILSFLLVCLFVHSVITLEESVLFDGYTPGRRSFRGFNPAIEELTRERMAEEIVQKRGMEKAAAKAGAEKKVPGAISGGGVHKKEVRSALSKGVDGIMSLLTAAPPTDDEDSKKLGKPAPRPVPVKKEMAGKRKKSKH